MCFIFVAQAEQIVKEEKLTICGITEESITIYGNHIAWLIFEGTGERLDFMVNPEIETFTLLKNGCVWRTGHTKDYDYSLTAPFRTPKIYKGDDDGKTGRIKRR